MAVDLVLKALTPVIEHVFPNKESQNEAKIKLVSLAESGQLRRIELQSNVIQAEATAESWLQRNWRPLTMLTFTGLVVAHWLGFTAPNLSEKQILSLLDIVKVGLGGYVLGRSAEKMMHTYKK